LLSAALGHFLLQDLREHSRHFNVMHNDADALEVTDTILKSIFFFFLHFTQQWQRDTWLFL
jgi:hypothetical protein